MRSIPSQLILVLGLSAALGAQSPICSPGSPNAFFQSTPLIVGSPITFTLTGVPDQMWVVFGSDTINPMVVPGVGTLCPDFNSPNFVTYGPGFLDSNGRKDFLLNIPASPFWLGVVIYAQCAVHVPLLGGPTLSNALRVDFVLPNSWNAVAGGLQLARSDLAGNLMSDGRVLLAGGKATSGTTNRTDIFDPVTRAITPGPNMNAPRLSHASVTLADGRVLFAGGGDDANPSANVQIFDPALGAFTPAASLPQGRTRHRMALLDDGRVFLVGGFVAGQIQSSALIYDPVANVWQTLSATLPSGRTRFGICRLPDGRILITGGNILSTDPVMSQSTTSCSIFDPMTESILPATPLPEPRLDHSCFVDGFGHAMVAGGYASLGISTISLPTNTSRFMDLNLSSWSAGPTIGLSGPRGSVELQDGDQLVVGGFGSTFTQGNTLRFDSTFASVLPALPESRAYQATVRLLDGSVLVAGGFRFESTVPSQFLTSAWVFVPNP